MAFRSFKQNQSLVYEGKKYIPVQDAQRLRVFGFMLTKNITHNI